MFVVREEYIPATTMYILKMAYMGLMLHHIYGSVNQLKAIISIFAIYM